MSNKRLPFKVTPKQFQVEQVGAEDIGIIEIPRYNDLTPNERMFIDSHMKDKPSLQDETVKVSQQIAEKSGKGLFDIYAALTQGDIQLLQTYLPEFMRLQNIQKEVTPIEKQVYATAILKFRILPDWTLEDTGDPGKIHPELVQAIADFAKKELNGWNEPPDPTEEDLKKSLEGNTGKKSTGRKSSGE